MNTQNTQEYKATHTPTPWTVIEGKLHGFKEIVSFGDDEPENRKWILEVPPSDTNINDAYFIVRACNAHEELLSACKVTLFLLDSVPTDIVNARKVLEAAIRNAEAHT